MPLVDQNKWPDFLEETVDPKNGIPRVVKRLSAFVVFLEGNDRPSLLAGITRDGRVGSIGGVELSSSASIKPIVHSTTRQT